MSSLFKCSDNSDYANLTPNPAIPDVTIFETVPIVDDRIEVAVPADVADKAMVLPPAGRRLEGGITVADDEPDVGNGAWVTVYPKSSGVAFTTGKLLQREKGFVKVQTENSVVQIPTARIRYIQSLGMKKLTARFAPVTAVGDATAATPGAAAAEVLYGAKEVSWTASVVVKLALRSGTAEVTAKVRVANGTDKSLEPAALHFFPSAQTSDLTWPPVVSLYDGAGGDVPPGDYRLCIVPQSAQLQHLPPQPQPPLPPSLGVTLDKARLPARETSVFQYAYAPVAAYRLQLVVPANPASAAGFSTHGPAKGEHPGAVSSHVACEEIWIANTPANGLGVHLLPGQAHVLASQGSGEAPKLIGSAPYATAGGGAYLDQLRLPLKPARALGFSRKSRSVRVDDAAGTLTETIEVQLKCHIGDLQQYSSPTVIVEECLYRWPQFAITASSHPHIGVTGKPQTVRFTVPQPTTAAPVTLSFTVVYSWRTQGQKR